MFFAFKKHKFDIITIGSATRDIFLISDQFQFIQSEQFSTGVGECLPFGSKIDAQKMVRSTGGGATNAAATFSQLGFNTAVIAKIGQGSIGQDVIAELEGNRIDTSLMIRCAGQTGYSTLLTDEKTGERSVIVYRGVSAKFSSEDIPWRKAKADWFYLTSLGGNLGISKKIIEHAAKIKAAIAWNPGGGEIKKGWRQISPLLEQVKIFNLNFEEAQGLTGETAIKPMLKKLARAGNIVIITKGAEGAYAHQDGKTYFARATKAKAVSRTGAGDAFGSGFVAGYIKTGDLVKSLQVASLNAESVIKIIGAKTGLLTQWPSSARLKTIKVKKV
ncbi:carbohydrate kinase family protein [Patescibacteria group bacterium]|nr:carbohydrate kinase family protein [Patescibacteria group bacterium]MBU1705705.1 carbohydrate kinase family protein [Patescibacteria group bacterium]